MRRLINQIHTIVIVLLFEFIFYFLLFSTTIISFIFWKYIAERDKKKEIPNDFTGIF
jgi:hypothetical protein